MKYDRPFLDFKKQITKLEKDYKLYIKDEQKAVELLSSISYYDLINGYKDTVAIDEDFNGTEIEDLYNLNYIDKSIQNILFKYSIYVENRFKTILSYCISAHLGVGIEDYLNKDLYYRENSKKTIDNILKSLKNNDFGNPTKHYKEKHNHIPPWILFKNITFNDSIDLFLGLNKSIQFDICNLLFNSRMEQKQALKFANNALIIVRKFRNVIAHNLKFISYKSKEEITLKDLSHIYSGTLIETSDFKNKIGKNDIYAMILSIATLLNISILQNNFYYDLYREFQRFRQFPNQRRLLNLFLLKTKIPNNIDERLLKVFKDK